MTRFVEERLVLTGVLVCETPLSIAGVSGEPHSDAPLIRDGTGQVFIPGTSLAGSIRAFLRGIETLADARIQPLLWGAAPPTNAKSDDPSAASLVIVADAPLVGAVPLTELRDGVGIDPLDGRAAPGIKYDREVVPKGARFALRIELDVTEALRQALGDMEPVSFLSLLREAFEKALIRLGAAGTRGLGRVHLEEPVISRARIGERAGVLDFLRGGAKPVNDPGHGFTLPPRLHVWIDWTPLGPTMVRAREAGTLGDVLPLTGATEQGIAPVLPGASIKGALRAIAERIMATVRGTHPHDPGEDRFVRIKGAQADRLVALLFGQPRPKPGEAAEEMEEARSRRVASGLRGRGALAVCDLYGGDLSPRLRTLALTGEEGDVVELRDLGGDFAMHVALDRWTAAPVDGKLYGAVTLDAPGFPAIELEIDPARLGILGSQAAKAALALLVLVLREGMAGGLTLGGGVTHGWGAVSLDAAALRVEGSCPDLDLPGTLNLMARGDEAAALDPLRRAWIAEISAEGEA